MATTTLGIFQLISIIYISIYEFKRKSLSVFLWATLLVMFGFPHFISIVTGITDFNEDTMIKASIFVIMFNCIYILTKSILYRSFGNEFNWNKNNCLDEIKNTNILNLRRQKRLQIYFLIIQITSLMIICTYAFKYFGGLSNASWGRFRTLGGQLNLFSFLRLTDHLFFASSGIALIYLLNNKKKMTILSLGILIFYVLITGNRITVLPILTSIILKYIFFNDKKVSFRTLIAIGLMGIASIYLVYFLRLLRIYGGFYTMFKSASIGELNKRTIEMILNGDGELGLRNAFYHFVYYDNKFDNFSKGHTYIRLLLITIPSFMLKGIKPPDFAISMGSAWSMNPYNTSYSMHPTLYGDCFANLWWFGILLGIFWAIIMYSIDRFICKKNDVIKVMLMVLFSVVYVIVGRGSVYNSFFIGLIATVIILSVNLISRIRL